MKRLATTCFLLITIAAYSQKCVVANVEENVLYIGVENPLDVAVDGYSCKAFTVTIDNGKIEATDGACSYMAHPEKPGKAEISIISKRTNSLIGKVEFRVKKLPDPHVTVGGDAGGLISKANMCAQRAVIGEYGNNIDLQETVTSFTVTIIRNGKRISYKECKGLVFTKDITLAFKSLEVGDKVIFTGTYKGPDNKKGELVPTEFEIF